jgi:lysophospholipase L1-like esterase
MQPAPLLVAWNQLIERCAWENSFDDVDDPIAMKDEENGLPESLSGDGAHPNRTGYAPMVPLAEGGSKMH